MLKNAPTLAIVAVHTEENEPPKIWGPKFHYFNPLLSEPGTRSCVSQLPGCKSLENHVLGGLENVLSTLDAVAISRGIAVTKASL